MKTIALLAAALLTLSVSSGSAEAQSRPGGCLKYGLGGAVAGHFAGGHRVKGALAGCVLGMYQRRKYDRDAWERAQYRERTADRRRERDSDASRSRPGSQSPRGPQNPRSPYEDLGLDIDRSRPSGQASRSAERNREGFEPGGSFSRGQYESRGAPRRYLEPEETGSFIRGSGKV